MEGLHKTVLNKAAIKEWLGEFPLAAEMYWKIRQGDKPLPSSYTLAPLGRRLPAWQETAEAYHKERASEGKRILIFATLHYWIEHAALLGLALAGLGHKVSLAFLPYANWDREIPRFDVRRQNAYTRSLLSKASPLIEVVSFLGEGRGASLPNSLLLKLYESTRQDTQYTLQMEDIDPQGKLFRLRMERNLEAVASAMRWMQNHKPDTVIVPNGTILEFGAVRLAAEHLGIRTVTYEFGEQNERIWLAQDAEVMRQETDDLWERWKDQPLMPEQMNQVRSLFKSRQRGSLWENFSRRWQGAPSEGGEKARTALGLDGRPVALMATNVFGDSLTLGRQVFSKGMGEWMERTLYYFAGRDDVQFIMRIHPGELLAKGPSAAVLVQKIFQEMPENLHVIAPEEKVNTYDLVEIADLGLVYTTTVGMEMAMSGLPVIVAGRTHYRGKGFTLDPETWDEYFHELDDVLARPAACRLTEAQTSQAWNYAYRFFFEYPHPFPWHLLHFWEDVEKWPLDLVLAEEGLEVFGRTFQYLAGEPIRWQS